MEILEGLLWAPLSGPAGTVAERFLALGALAASGGCVAFLIYALKFQKNLNTQGTAVLNYFGFPTEC